MKKARNILEALSDKNRFKIVRLLLEEDHSIKKLLKNIDIDESNINKNLDVLENADLVQENKKVYSISESKKEGLKNLINGLSQIKRKYDNSILKIDGRKNNYSVNI